MLLPILEPGINKKYKKIQKILEENIYIYISEKSIIQRSENCRKMVEENNIRD
jgi:hypothetical protein